jgi:hypothetical protein
VGKCGRAPLLVRGAAEGVTAWLARVCRPGRVTILQGLSGLTARTASWRREQVEFDGPHRDEGGLGSAGA